MVALASDWRFLLAATANTASFSLMIYFLSLLPEIVRAREMEYGPSCKVTFYYRLKYIFVHLFKQRFENSSRTTDLTIFVWHTGPTGEGP